MATYKQTYFVAQGKSGTIAHIRGNTKFFVCYQPKPYLFPLEMFHAQYMY